MEKKTNEGKGSVQERARQGSARRGTRLTEEIREVVYVRAGRVRDMQEGTLYIDSQAHTAQWLCPCGCGSKCEVKWASTPFDYAWRLPEGMCALDISDEGEVSLSCGYMSLSCPMGLAHVIDHNQIKVLATNGKY